MPVTRQYSYRNATAGAIALCSVIGQKKFSKKQDTTCERREWYCFFFFFNLVLRKEFELGCVAIVNGYIALGLYSSKQP